MNNNTLLTFFESNINDPDRVVLSKHIYSSNGEVCSSKSNRNPSLVHFIQQKVESITSLYSNLIRSSHNKFKALILGSLLDWVPRTKNRNTPSGVRRMLDKPNRPGTVIDSPTPLLVLDLDKIPLKAIGYENIKFSSFNGQEFSDIIVENLFPCLKETAHIVQLSSSFGINSRDTFSCHIFFLMKKKMVSKERKEFMLSLDKGRKFLDTQVASANQIIYTANPILGEGLDKDPLDERIYLCDRVSKKIRSSLVSSELEKYREKEGLRINNKLLPKQIKVGTKEVSLKGKSIHQLYEAVLKGDNLHQSVLELTLYLALSMGYKSNEETLENSKIYYMTKKTILSSNRATTDYERVKGFLDTELVPLIKGALDITSSLNLNDFQKNLSKHPKAEKNMLDIFNSGMGPGSAPVSIQTKKQNNKFIRLNEVLPKTLVMDSDMGTGKTHALKEVCEKVFKDISIDNSRVIEPPRILIITPTASLARSVSERYNAINYEDVKHNDVSVYELWNPVIGFILVSCVNSVPFLFDGNDFDDIFDLIIFEECDQIINQVLFGPFVEDRGEYYETLSREGYYEYLCRITRKAKRVICSQYNVQQLTLHFLNACGRGKITTFENTYKSYRDLPVTMFETKTQEVNSLISSLDEGVNCLVACNSKVFAERLYTQLVGKFPIKNILSINSSNSSNPDQKEFLDDPNSLENGKKWDCIIFTYSMGTGISIEGGSFKRIFGFYEVGDKVGTPDSFMQMLGRGRDPNSISFWCSPRVMKEARSPDALMLELASHYEHTLELTRTKKKKKGGKTIYGSTVASINFEVTDFMRLKVIALSLKQEMAQRPAQTLFSSFQEQLACIVFVPKTNEPLELEPPDKESVPEYKELVLDASIISKEKRELLKRTPSITEIEAYQCKRFDLEIGLGLNLSQLNDKQVNYVFDFWNGGKGIKKIESLEEALLPQKQAKSLMEYYLNILPKDDPKFKFSTRWEIGSTLLEKVGIDCKIDGSACSLKSKATKFKYIDIANSELGEYIKINMDRIKNSGEPFDRLNIGSLSSKTFSTILSSYGVVVRTKQTPKKGGGLEYYAYLDTTRIKFLQLVIRNRYKHSTGVIHFAGHLF